MQLFSLAFSNIFLIPLFVLLTWTSLAQGAAINRDISPARRDLGVEARTSGVQDGIEVATKLEGETLAGRDTDSSGGFVDDWYTLAARTTEASEEDEDTNGHGHLPRRWYTLVEIAETQESE